MGPENENNPKPQTEDKISAVPSSDYWELTVKLTVKAESADEAQAQVEEMLDEDDRIISYDYAGDSATED